MKKLILLILAVLLGLCCASCGGKMFLDAEEQSAAAGSFDQAALEEKALVSAAPSVPPPSAKDTSSMPDPSETPPVSKEDAEIDVDLTELSTTMVYSEIYNMMLSPESYEGKTVRMKGKYICYEDPQSGKEYFACIVTDAAACCAQGFEFVPAEGSEYPNDYLDPNCQIVITGIFEIYQENNFQFCRLVDVIPVRLD